MGTETTEVTRLEELAEEPNGTLVQIQHREECNSDVYFSTGHLNYSPGQGFIMLLNGVHPDYFSGSKSADMHRRLDIDESRFVDYTLLVPQENTD